MQKLLKILEERLTGQKGHYTLILLDIDFFLRYRLRFSSAACDQMLEQIRRFLPKAAEHAVQGARFIEAGGDEFALLLPGADLEKGVGAAEEIRLAFRRHRFTEGLPAAYRSLRISFSAGVVNFPEDAGDVSTLLHRAITALFMAKALRRNQVFSYRWQIAGGEIRPREHDSDSSRLLYVPDATMHVITGGPGRVGTLKQALPKEQGILWEPQAIAADEQGWVYIADQDSHQIVCCGPLDIFRVAGCGRFGYSGDGGNALSACLNKPTGLWCRKDSLYIADTGNDVVRRISRKDSYMETLAGQGTAGDAGDGGPAGHSLLNKPGGVAVDRECNVYIADIANNRLRCIGRDGTIRPFAGCGRFGYSGDGGDALDAEFQEIYGIGMSAAGDKLYLADYGNHRIRKIDLFSRRIDTIAGCGRPGYSGDGGDAREACLQNPVAVCGDSRGNVFIADAGNQAVRILPAGDKRSFTVAGGVGIGTGRSGEGVRDFALANPNGLAVYQNTLYILDGANNRVCCLQVD